MSAWPRSHFPYFGDDGVIKTLPEVLVQRAHTVVLSLLDKLFIIKKRFQCVVKATKCYFYISICILLNSSCVV